MRDDLALLRDPVAVLRMAAMLGLRVTAIGERASCVLRGHGKHAASLWPDPCLDGVHKYRCWGTPVAELPYYLLSQAYAWIAYGDQRPLSDIECATWNLRLVAGIGELQPAHVALPSLPRDVRPSWQKVYDGFALLVGLRWTGYPEQPVAYARPFARAWCGVSTRTAGDAIRYFVDRGFIVPVGFADSDPRLRLFRPGAS